VFRVGEVVFFKIFVFSCLGLLFHDFGRFWAGLGRHFESQRATKMASKFDAKNDGFLDRSRNGFGRPLGGLWGSTGGPWGEEPKVANFGGGVPFRIRTQKNTTQP